MSYSCKILLDSISETGKRITTFEITFPRIVLSEFNTHRMFSRNSASSRAIPFDKQVQRINNDPFIPEKFPLNAKGMQPQAYLTEDNSSYSFDRDTSDYQLCKNLWLAAMNNSIGYATELKEHSVHKQIVNRLLEPFMWHTVIVTATEFDNFFKLRCDENAQYEIRRIADLMYEAYHAYDVDKFDNKDITRFGVPNNWSAIRPQRLKIGEWHCPLVYEEDRSLVYEYWGRKEPRKYSILSEEHRYNYATHLLKQVSVARCARVSYLTHDGKRDIEKDLELFERLRTSGHWSPFEHVATPYFWNENTTQREHQIMKEFSIIDNHNNYRSGNFTGWKQFRKEFADENCTDFRKNN